MTLLQDRLLEAALRYAELGIPVLPVWWIHNGKCTCGETCEGKPGKHPVGLLAPHGVHSATTDSATIRRWWEGRFRHSNIGLAAGEKSGFDALDVDGPIGRETLAKLEAEHGALPATVEAETGGGGRHILFAHVPGLKNGTKFWPGLDNKTTGGGIVVSPSTHETGRTYEWLPGHAPGELPYAPAPQWLLNLIPKAYPAKANGTHIITPQNGIRIPEGERHSTLVKYAGRYRRMGLDDVVLTENLASVNAHYCDPPVSDAEVARIAQDIAKHEPGDPVQTDEGTARIHTVCMANVAPELTRWLWYPRVPLGELTVICGDGGMGKSQAAISVAATVSRGWSFPDSDCEPRPPENVLLIVTEDSLSRTVRPRLDAADADVARIHAVEKVSVIGKNGQHEIPLTLSMVHEMRALLKEIGSVRLVVIDAAADLMPGKDGNSEQDVREVLRGINVLATDFDLSILIVKHLSKGTAGGQLAYRVGGSVAWNNRPRAGFILAEAPTLGPNEFGKNRRVMFPTKHNLGPPPAALEYHLGPFRWGSPVAVTADELRLGQLKIPKRSDSPKGGRPNTKRVAAQEFLTKLLADGPIPFREIEVAGEDEGHTEATLRRAFAALKGFTKGGHRRAVAVWSLKPFTTEPEKVSTPGSEICQTEGIEKQCNALIPEENGVKESKDCKTLNLSRARARPAGDGTDPSLETATIPGLPDPAPDFPSDPNEGQD